MLFQWLECHNRLSSLSLPGQFQFLHLSLDFAVFKNQVRQSTSGRLICYYIKPFNQARPKKGLPPINWKK